MTKTNKHTTGVLNILKRAQAYNSNIGSYIEHYIDNNLNFKVRLTNGQIEIPMTIAQDQEIMPKSIPNYKIKNIANSFTSSTTSQNHNTQQILQTQSVIMISFWERLLKWFGLK
jgi:hypothetical protein